MEVRAQHGETFMFVVDISLLKIKSGCGFVNSGMFLIILRACSFPLDSRLVNIWEMSLNVSVSITWTARSTPSTLSNSSRHHIEFDPAAICRLDHASVSSLACMLIDGQFYLWFDWSHNGNSSFRHELARQMVLRVSRSSPYRVLLRTKSCWVKR